VLGGSDQKLSNHGVPAGNPMDSVHIQRLQQGYLKRLHSQLVKPTPSQPWTQEEVLKLVQFLRREMEQAEGVELVALIRDGFLVTVMWELQCRGANAGSWRLENLRLPGGKDALLA